MRSTAGTSPAAAAGGRLESAPTNGTNATDGFAVPGFDAVARLAARALDVPLVALVLNNGSAYWFTSGSEIAARNPRPLHPFYLEAARRLSGQVVFDTRQDERFRGIATELVADPEPIRFFASEPVFTLTGQQIGALCVMDVIPRSVLSEAETAGLRDAAALAGAGVVLRSYLGRTHPVTQLPSRNAFFEDLRAHLGAGMLAWVVAIDVAPVHRFNAFVRAMGHAYADELMRAVAVRVRAWLTPDARLYQVETMRLALMLPPRHVLLEPERLDDLVARLRQPFDSLGIPLTLQPGVGLLETSADDLRGGDALRRVMSASYAAQHNVRGWAVYDHAQDERHRQEFFLVTELAAALTERAELDLYYQPRVSLDDGRCLGMEALLRWHHPTLGLVTPDRFIGLAERAGLMRALTQWVFDHGLAQLAAWRREGHDLRLSLNVSGSDLGADLLERLRDASARHGVDLGLLELEFTEGTLMEHTETTRRHLEDIRKLGIGIAIDDFGTGYSNIAALRQMPATALKIDQSFVRDIEAEACDVALVRAVAELARHLGFRVVVEGVETARIYESVLGMACDEAQGFYIAMPMPAAEVPRWLAGRAALPTRGA